MTLPDPGRSRAVLIGVSEFTTLEPLPAVANNLTALASCLQDRDLWGLPDQHCQVVAQPDTPEMVAEAVHAAAEKASDTLLVYYSGHGLVDSWTSEKLLLALPRTVTGRPHTTVPFEWVRQPLLNSRASRRIVILDCCYSGRALGTMGDSTVAVADQAFISGTFLLASAPENSPALAPPGEKYTAFTGALIELLTCGCEGGPELLDLDTIYRHVRHNLLSRGLPEPQARERNLAGSLRLVRNRALHAKRVGTTNPAASPQAAPHEQTVPLTPIARARLRRTLSGHTAMVQVVAWSPDGAALATASDDTTVRIWDGAEGTLRHTLAGAGAYVTWSPDGRFLATPGRDATVVIWDAATGERSRGLRGGNGGVGAVAWSPDGRLLAVAAGEGEIEIWEPATSRLVRVLGRHRRDVMHLAWAPDGRRLASGSDDFTARIWDVATGQPQHHLRGHKRPVAGVAWSPDGRSVATASGDYTVRVWDAETGEHKSTFSGHSGRVWSASWSPDGHRIATSSYDKTAQIWRPGASTAEYVLRAPHKANDRRHSVWSVAWSPDGRYLATGGGDHTARVWEVEPTDQTLNTKRRRRRRPGVGPLYFEHLDGPLNVENDGRSGPPVS
jgi:Tol biopolymer transport system component